MPEQPQISVVIPVCNEQQDVVPLTRSLQSVLGEPYEIIFIDDGSTDATWENLTPLHDPGRVRLVRFRRNFGKTAALAAGFSLARGDVIITMDGDLQDEPKEIPRFLQKLAEGYDLVVGWKKQRHDPSSKVIASRIFNYVVAKATGLDLHDINCGFKAFQGNIARSLRLYGEMHRFIPVLVFAEGHRVSEIEVTHHPRRHGRSKYGFSRLFKGLFDLITVMLTTRFRERPSHAFGFTAVAALVFGLVVLLIGFLRGPHWFTGFLALVSWLAAIILVAAGWLAEMIVARQAHPAPPFYSVEERLD